MNMSTIHAVLIAAVLSLTTAHSVLTYPQPMHPAECRRGGLAKFGGVKTCDGPCRLDRLYHNPIKANFYPPAKPAAVWKRGQSVTLKYTRNNHGPGGFVRFTLVPVAKAMNKAVHARNAFHFSCWGAHPAIASKYEMQRDTFGFSMIGSDGNKSRYRPGYYKEQLVIPAVIPNGNYILGWVWYGGIGGRVLGNGPQKPRNESYFGDYWACSFVRVYGGASLLRKYTPVFANGNSQFSDKGCMSFTDKPGVCTNEPCIGIPGKYQKPAEFKGGRTPLYLTPLNFMYERQISKKSTVMNESRNNNMNNTSKLQKPKDKNGPLDNAQKRSLSNPALPRMRTGWGKNMHAHKSSAKKDLMKKHGDLPSSTAQFPKIRTKGGNHEHARKSPAKSKHKNTKKDKPSLNSGFPRMRTGWGKNGQGQKILPSQFPSPSLSPSSSTTLKEKGKTSAADPSSALQKFLSCLCISKNEKCSKDVARRTKCQSDIPASKQPETCASNCCEYCENSTKSELCKNLGIEGGCRANN